MPLFFYRRFPSCTMIVFLSNTEGCFSNCNNYSTIQLGKNKWILGWTRDDQEKVIIPIRQAINHNGDYLLTVLFHNRTQQAIHLSNIHLSVSSPYFQAVQHQFPTTEWYVEPQTSSPWTFIFREMNYSGELADDVRDLQIEFISTI